jgi:hypothetical protein
LAKRFSDVVLPQNCEQPAKKWLDTQHEDDLVECNKRPRRHGNSRKQSNNAKSEVVVQRFLDFVDNNSASNGQKEGSSGKTFYFDCKFTQIRTPDKKDPQFQYKCKNSVLFEFNRKVFHLCLLEHFTTVKATSPLCWDMSINVRLLNKKRCCKLCDGSGHIQQGKKRHFSEKYCPKATKSLNLKQ